MSIFSFIKLVFCSHPRVLLGTGTLFFMAGVLELLSIATVLPVLLSTLNAAGDIGFAGDILTAVGIGDLSLGPSLAAIAVMMSLRGLFMMAADYFMAKLARDIEAKARSEMFSGLVEAEWSYLLGVNLGEIPNIILRETEKYNQAIQKLGQLISSTLIAGILISSSLFVSWQAFLVFLCAALPYLWVTRYVTRKIKGEARERLKEANQISTQIAEVTLHLKYVKAGGLERLVVGKFGLTVKKYADHFFRIIVLSRFIKNFPEIFGVLILAGLIAFSHRYMDESPTDLLFFLLLLFRGYRQFAGVQSILAALIENVPSYQICSDFIRAFKDHKERSEGQRQLEGASLKLSSKDLCFSYEADAQAVLRGINLEIPERGIVAFVGPSGAGKTTLADMMLGLLSPQNGGIYIAENIILSSINIHAWREKMGYVPQEPFLVSGTIRENILMNALDQSDDNLRVAAELSQSIEFIEKFEGGFDTLVGAAGKDLSGGQKQRIALARALARKPDMLIMDEATSALDTLTEQAIQNVIKKIADTRPVIIIAHRLSTIQDANIIYVFDEGQIVERGQYQELIEKGGLFSELKRASL